MTSLEKSELFSQVWCGEDLWETALLGTRLDKNKRAMDGCAEEFGPNFCPLQTILRFSYHHPFVS